MEIEATEVFEVTWEAINDFLTDEAGEYILDDLGRKQRKYKYIIHEGSSRSSKTHSIIQALYLYGLKNKDRRLSVWRDTRKVCKDTVGFDMGRIYPYMPFNKTVFYQDGKSQWKFVLSKSVLELNGTDDEEKVHGFNGSVSWLNEPYKISKETFNQIDQRTSDFLVIDWNPKKAHWIEDLKKDKRALVIHSTFLKNPFCPPEQRIKILSYQPVSMCKAVSEGMLDLKSAMVYDIGKNKIGLNSRDLSELSRCQENEIKNSASEFNWMVYGLGLKAERPNRVFRWKEISDQEWFNIDSEVFYGIDWGKVDPWGIVAVKYYDGALYCRELNYESENEIRNKLTATERAQIDGMEEGLVLWKIRDLGIDFEDLILCDNNRIAKIVAMREAGYDNALAAIKGPGSVLDGVDLLIGMEVYYTSSSTNLKYEQENYSRKTDRYGIVLEDFLDKDNHLIDPIRYVAQELRKEGYIKIV